MADITIANESKNNITITNEDKPAAQTWDDMTIPWDEATSTWDQPGIPIIKETKNNITITNENKN